jgi:hypothetical protein
MFDPGTRHEAGARIEYNAVDENNMINVVAYIDLLLQGF